MENLPIVLRGFDLQNSEHFEPKAIGWAVNFLRNKIGLTKIPDVDKEGPGLMIHQTGVSTIPIGIKKDETGVKGFPNGLGGEVVYKQELL